MPAGAGCRRWSDQRIVLRRLCGSDQNVPPTAEFVSAPPMPGTSRRFVAGPERPFVLLGNSSERRTLGAFRHLLPRVRPFSQTHMARAVRDVHAAVLHPGRRTMVGIAPPR